MGFDLSLGEWGKKEKQRRKAIEEKYKMSYEEYLTCLWNDVNPNIILMVEERIKSILLQNETKNIT